MREVLTVGELLFLMIAVLLLTFLLTAAPDCSGVQNTEEIQEQTEPECSNSVCMPSIFNQKGS